MRAPGREPAMLGEAYTPPRPVGGDEVLVRAERRCPVKKDRISFGRKAVFVGVAGDACDAFQGEVKRDSWETRACEKRD
ncbi:hypothetical protein HO173_013363 [Letharia columbiana]|uniref:Uncharacterized protein n=1 Tax=Letharia columbiana TaxID=112416 RepID=A0A8H6FBR8_9LECA|nr:uncharacterized protein HO173_013363 [Letharia columbiana]KAF6222530.1 hypothetical protein HO173_013363 [Letharia columbiana]